MNHASVRRGDGAYASGWIVDTSIQFHPGRRAVQYDAIRPRVRGIELCDVAGNTQRSVGASLLLVCREKMA